MTQHWKPRAVDGIRRGRSIARSHRRPRRGFRIGWGEARLTVLAGVALGLGIVLLPDAAPLPIAAAGAQVAEPWRAVVIDGDTFRYGGDKIRIADIDTPEVNGRCPSETALAARATVRMGELLHAGPFALERVGGRDEDRYGRKLRVVTRGGRSLGDQMVAEGLARTWTGRREPWCA